MKKFLIALACAPLLALSLSAQQALPKDSQPSKEDIEKYYAAMHIRDLMKATMEATAKQMREITHAELKKQAPEMTPEMIAKLDQVTDEVIKSVDMEEMLQAMTPVYQKHLTKGDLEALVAFYSTPVGQKILREMPAITQEAMQAVSGIMQKEMEIAMQKAQQAVTEMMKETPKSKP